MYYGVQGIGETFSFYIDLKTPSNFRQWEISQYVTSKTALAIMTHILCHSIDENKPITDILLKFAEILTKDKKKLGPKYKELSLSTLSKFIIIKNLDIMNSASNLIISKFYSREY